MTNNCEYCPIKSLFCDFVISLFIFGPNQENLITKRNFKSTSFKVDRAKTKSAKGRVDRKTTRAFLILQNKKCMEGKISQPFPFSHCKSRSAGARWEGKYAPVLPGQQSNMAEEEDKGFLQEVISEEAEKSSNVLLSYVKTLGGAAQKVYNLPNVDVWPDIERVNRLLDVWTCVGYGVGTMAAVGTVYYSLRTSREISQWRAWLKFRKIYPTRK